MFSARFRPLTAAFIRRMSVAAYGPLAAHLTSTHHLDDTQCAPTSPYGQGARDGSAHRAARRRAGTLHGDPSRRGNGRPGGLSGAARRRGALLVPRPRRRDIPGAAAPAPAPQPRFSAICRAALARGRLHRGELAGTPWLAVAQRDLLDEVLAALERDPRAIIAPPGAPIIP